MKLKSKRVFLVFLLLVSQFFLFSSGRLENNQAQASGVVDGRFLGISSLSASHYTNPTSEKEEITLNFVTSGIVVSFLTNAYMIFEVPPEISAVMSSSEFRDNLVFTYDIPYISSLGIDLARSTGKFSTSDIVVSPATNQIYVNFASLLSIVLDPSAYRFSLKIVLDTLPPASTGNYTFSAETTKQIISLESLQTVSPTATFSAPTLIKRTVVFNLQGRGNTISDIEVENNSLITEPTAPTSSGYTFVGWYKEDSLTTLWDFAVDKVTANTTLYAKWTPVTYEVTFNTNGGSTVDAVDASYDTTIIAPTPPIKANYIFAGWYKDAHLNDVWSFATDKVDGDTTLYAKWTAITSSSTNNPDASIVDTNELVVIIEKSQNYNKSVVEGVRLIAKAEDIKQTHTLKLSKINNTSQFVQNKDGLISLMYGLNVTPAFSSDESLTLVFTFDTSKVSSNQEVVVRYYNETTTSWDEVAGSQIKGNEIAIQTTRSGKYGVFVKDRDIENEDNTFTPPVQVNDIEGHSAEASIKEAIQKGIIKGYPDSTFRPNGLVTRAEFATMLVNGLNLGGKSDELKYTDSNNIGVWAKEAIGVITKIGIMQGYPDGSFIPQKTITRAELSVIISRILGEKSNVVATEGQVFKDEKDIPVWARKSVKIAVEAGMIEGQENQIFRPQGVTTRAEAVIVIMKLIAWMKN